MNMSNHERKLPHMLLNNFTLLSILRMYTRPAIVPSQLSSQSLELNKLDSCTSSEHAPPSSHEEQDNTHHGCEKPQQHVRQIHPNGVLHPHDSTIALSIGVDVETPKDSKHRRPQNTTTALVLFPELRILEA